MFNSELIKIIKETPNDSELGQKIRNLYFKQSVKRVRKLEKILKL